MNILNKKSIREKWPFGANLSLLRHLWEHPSNSKNYFLFVLLEYYIIELRAERGGGVVANFKALIFLYNLFFNSPKFYPHLSEIHVRLWACEIMKFINSPLYCLSLHNSITIQIIRSKHLSTLKHVICIIIFISLI